MKKEYYVTAVFANGQVLEKPRSKTPPPWGSAPPPAMPAPVEFAPSPIPPAPSLSSKGYVYIAELTEEQAVEVNEFGMYAVVEFGATNIMCLVLLKVAQDLDYSSYDGSYKHIVSIVDTGPYEEKKAKAARRVAIKKHLARLAEEAKERIKMEDLLEGNDEAKALFDELKGL